MHDRSNPQEIGGLRHILMRIITVPSAQAARKSVLWATGRMDYFYLLTSVIGFGTIVMVATESAFSI